MITDLAIYAASIANLTDARYFAAWGAKWLGFPMEPNIPGNPAPNQIQGMIEWTDGVDPVGEFGLQTADEIRRAAELLNFKAVKLSHFTDLSVIEELSDLPIIKEWIIGPDLSLAQLQQNTDDLAGQVAYHLLDFTKATFNFSAFENSPDFEALQQICDTNACLLNLDWTPAILKKALETINPEGIVLKGGAEEKVGFKSFEELDDLFEVMSD